MATVRCQSCGDFFRASDESEYDTKRCSCGAVTISYKPRESEVVGGMEVKKVVGYHNLEEWIDGAWTNDEPNHHPDLIQQRALETWHSKDKDFFLQLNHAILQLSAEGGEVAALWAKFNYKPAFKLLDGMTREETFKAKLLDELGDVLYYLAVLAHLYGWTIEDISQRNHEKLRGGHGWKSPSQ